MSLYLQGEIWWYEFYIGKQRYRSSTRTTAKNTALQVEAEHKESLTRTGKKVSATLQAIKVAELDERRAKIWEGVQTKTEPPEEIRLRHNTHPELAPSSLLQDAGDLFLATQRARGLRKATLDCNRAHLQRLVEFFGNIPLSQFTVAHFEHYQSVRGARCGASAVNQELNTLGRILRKVDLWFQIKKNYARLKDRETKPAKIFTVEESEKIFRALRENPNLELANIVFTITRNTTASGCELRGLRISSLELEVKTPKIHIPPDSTKNIVRPRTIPLNEDALDACRKALARAKRLGSHYPEHYVFPLRVDRATWDPLQPASKSWLVKQVRLLRQVTRIHHITPHIFRHLAVTQLLERGAKEQTVIALAGWVSRRMFETYSHPRMESKLEAVQLLQTDQPTRPNLPAPPAKAPSTSAESPAPTNADSESLVERRAEELLRQWLEKHPQMQILAPAELQGSSPQSTTISMSGGAAQKPTVRSAQLTGGSIGHHYF